MLSFLVSVKYIQRNTYQCSSKMSRHHLSLWGKRASKANTVTKLKRLL